MGHFFKSEMSFFPSYILFNAFELGMHLMIESTFSGSLPSSKAIVQLMLPQTVSDIFKIRKQSHAHLWFAKPPEDVEGPEACKLLSCCPES